MILEIGLWMVSLHFAKGNGSDAAVPVQILCDLIQSNGIVGGPYVSPEERTTAPVELVFCNPDLLWRSDFPRPRFGQGAFREAFQAVYKARHSSSGTCPTARPGLA